MNYVVSHAIPAVDEFCELRIEAGLSAMDRHAAASALPRSLHAVTIRDGDQLIAMGRIVGDGLHVQVVDIAVKPAWQGNGLSRIVMEDIMSFIETLPTSTIVNLFADIDWLYGKFGFVVPTHTTGMSLHRGADGEHQSFDAVEQRRPGPDQV